MAPRVPVYQQQVRSRALSLPQARPLGPSGLGQLGAGLQQAGGAALDIAQKAQDDANRFRVAQLDLEVGKAINDASYGQNGFLLSQGENALGYEERLAELQKSLAKIEGSAANDAQRAILREKIASRLENTRSSWLRHADAQRRELFAGISKAQQDLAVEAARTNFDDPARVEQEVQRLLVEPDGTEGVLMRDLRSRGLPQEEIQLAIGNLRARAYGAVLEARLDAGDVEGAKRWYEEKKDQLGPAGAKFGRTIVQAERAQRAHGAAAQLIERARDPESGRVDEAAVRGALAALNERDAETRKAIGEAVQPLLANEKAMWSARQKEWRNLARGLYNRGGLNAVRAAQLPGGGNLLDWLNQHDAEYEATLRRDAERRARQGRESQRERNERDRQALAEFRALDPEERLQVDPEDFGFQFGASQLGVSLLRAEQQRAKQAVEKKLVISERDFVRDATMQALALPAFSPQGAGKLTARQRQKDLRAAASVAFQRETEKLGRDLTEDERQRLLDLLVTKHTVREGWLWDDEEFGFETVLREEEERRGGGEPTAAAEPGPKRAPSAGARSSADERMDELLDAGLAPEVIAEILRAEGYN